MKRLILDTNILCALFEPVPQADIQHLSKAVIYGTRYQVQLVLGGRLEDEYYGHHRLKKVFLELIRAGRLVKFPRPVVDTEENHIARNFIIRSNDPHVLALARISGARILCSRDQPLHADFTDKRLVDNPRGKVWQSDSHNHLLLRIT